MLLIVRRIADRLVGGVEGGESLADALAPNRHIFDPHFAACVDHVQGREDLRRILRLSGEQAGVTPSKRPAAEHAEQP